MDFAFTDDQLALQESIEKIMQHFCDDQQLAKLANSETFFHQSLWQQLLDSGVQGAPFAESAGGVGLGLVEFCLMLELQGKYVAPLPLLSSVVDCGMLLAACPPSTLRDDYLSAVIGGDILAPAQSYSGVQAVTPLRANASKDAWVLDGRSGFVPYAPLASAYIVAVRSDAGEDLIIALEREQVACIAQTAINDEPAGYLNFAQVSVPATQVLAQGQSASQLLQQQQLRRQVCLGALQLGVLTEGLRRTASYVSERQQFGRVLGGFQAVSQQAADAYMQVECLRSVYWRALDYIEHAESVRLAAPVVQYWVAQAGHKVAHSILHLHGGIGQDLSYPIHRFFLFAKYFERYAGSPHQSAHHAGLELLGMSHAQLVTHCL